MENSKEFQLPMRGPKICTNDIKEKNLNKEQLSEEAKNKIYQHKALFSISSPRFTMDVPVKLQYLRHLRSVAIFKSRNEIDVIKRVGKMFQYFGTQTKDTYKLLPEEALFLLEMNYLELQWNTIPMSIQQAYAVLLNEDDIYCKLRHYRIYSHLSRKSYRLLRHTLGHEQNVALEDTTNINPPKKQKLEIQEKVEITPLIDDSVIDINEAMRRLQIFNTNPPQAKNISFIYDGYNPHKNFCKSNIPSEPDISVNYACANDTVPTVFQRNGQTKFLFALEGTKDVVYYCVKHVSVKNLLQS